MTVSRATYRSHLGRTLGPHVYANSRSTAASSNNSEIVDAKRTEADDFWGGATARVFGVTTEDVPVRGGAGANTSRTPTILLDQALTAVPAISTNYELLKSWDFNDVDDALDESLAGMWPYFWDAVDDTSLVIADQTIDYALDPTWREIVRIQQQVFNTTPTRYFTLYPGVDYDLVQGATTFSIILRQIPTGNVVGMKLRVFARAIPTLGATDASTSIHPWQVVAPGAAASLFRKGPNADAGNLGAAWERKADRAEALFTKRRLQMARPKPPVEMDIPVVLVNRYGS